jgi:hypothetical protein
MKHERLFAVVDSPRLDDILADWRWLVHDDVDLVAVTAMGDLVLKDKHGKIQFLDTIEGKYEQIADDDAGYQELLKSSQFRQKYLQYYCVLLLVEEGITLGKNECYSPDVPPHLGGELDEKNLKPTDIYVHFSLSGQVWQQTKDLPAGTKIDDVRIEQPKSGLFGTIKNLFQR